MIVLDGDSFLYLQFIVVLACVAQIPCDGHELPLRVTVILVLAVGGCYTAIAFTHV
jgi:hypothetical protein